MQTIDLRDIITEEFQDEIQESFSLATGFGVVFTDKEGNHIGPGANFCQFCNKINATNEGAQQCALSNKRAIEIALETKKPSIYICHAGLVNIEIPLIYENKCVGAITAGQVLCSEENAYPSDQVMERSEWMDDAELLPYYREIEVMNCQQIEATTKALSNITNYIIQNVVQAKLQEKLARQTEDLLRSERQRLQLEQLLQQAQMDALQKQVMPHFIFNVINSISRLLALKEYDTVEKMLEAFSQMMRYSLSDTNTSVTLEQELEYINNYLSIQAIRFQERIRYEIFCDKALRTLRIPFFSLQPLVENAIEHGLLNKEEGGILKLRCLKTESGCVVEVADNGIGISQDALHRIRNNLRVTNQEIGQKHIGLRNSYSRFSLMFHEQIEFSIQSAAGEGTCVMIRI